MDAEKIVSAVTRGEISIDNVVEDSLTRCAAVQEKLNPFTAIYADEARQKARTATARLKQAGTPRLLEGVPVAIKEFTPIKGKITSRGSAALKDCVEDFQPALVRRLEEAGAIIVARTTTPEFAHSSFTRSPLRDIRAIPLMPPAPVAGLPAVQVLPWPPAVSCLPKGPIWAALSVFLRPFVALSVSNPVLAGYPWIFCRQFLIPFRILVPSAAA